MCPRVARGSYFVKLHICPPLVNYKTNKYEGQIHKLTFLPSPPFFPCKDTTSSSSSALVTSASPFLHFQQEVISPP